MLGWEEQVAAVAKVYQALPRGPSGGRRSSSAGNYGEAGAIDFFGPRYGLPGAVSPAGSYWFFGPGRQPGRRHGDPRSDPGGPGAVLRLAGPPRPGQHPWAVEEERDLTIFVARRPRRTLQQVWPTLAGRN